MKQQKHKIIIGVMIVAVLAFVFWYGGNSPGLRGWVPQQKQSVNPIENDIPEQNVTTTEAVQPTDVTASPEPSFVPETEANTKPEPTAEETPTQETVKAVTEENQPQNQDNMPVTSTEKTESVERFSQNSSNTALNGNKKYSEENGMVFDEKTGKDKYLTDPVPEGKPLPTEPQNAVISDREFTCTLSVRCDTILENIAWLDKDKVDIVPQDGVIFAEKTVTFYEGESVFHVLLREMKRNQIHMEFENTPIYNSAYIEGIGNLYEFDCGELSGWMYQVNGWFPNYGCSRYQLKDGDRVEWIYTCNLGIDIGGPLRQQEKSYE